MVGISPLTAGYQSIRIAPLITKHLTFAEGSYRSAYGLIGSIWRRNDNELEMEIVIPPNSQAIVEIPKRTFRQISNWQADIPIALGENIYLNGERPEQDQSTATVTLDAGHYRIEVRK